MTAKKSSSKKVAEPTKPKADDAPPADTVPAGQHEPTPAGDEAQARADSLAARLNESEAELAELKLQIDDAEAEKFDDDDDEDLGEDRPFCAQMWQTEEGKRFLRSLGMALDASCGTLAVTFPVKTSTATKILKQAIIEYGRAAAGK